MAMNNRLMRPKATAAAPPSGTPASLLMRFDGNFNDSSANALTVTVNGDAAISTTTKKYGSGGGHFYGGSATLPSSSLFEFDGDFTIEGWFYFTANDVGYQPLVAASTGSDATGWILLMETVDTIYFYGSGGSSWTSDLSRSTPYQPPTGEWIHLAVVRSGQDLSVYANGVNVTEAAQPASSGTIVSGSTVTVGSYLTLPPFAGFIDDLRIVKGLAVYTANFTPPTAPLAVNATPHVPQPPAAPTGVSATSGNGELSIAWTAPYSESAITGYVVEYTPAGGSATTVSTGSIAVIYLLAGLTDGTAYTVRVAAVSAVGTGPYSSASAPATPDASSFAPAAVLLTSGTSYTVPAGATSMKAWAVGSGSVGNLPGSAGGCAFKTWSVSGGTTVTYGVGAARTGGIQAGQNTTVTYSGTTITGNGGGTGGGGSFSGGDGGAAGGGSGTVGWGDYGQSGGAVGGNGTRAACGRLTSTNVSGLFAALALAGVSTSETCAAGAAFGSGGADQKFGPVRTAGRGGGGIGPAPSLSIAGTPSGGGAVVLYFT